MSKRYVGRVPLGGPSRTRRVVARVPARWWPRSPSAGAAVARGVAVPVSPTTAGPVDGATQLLQSPDVTAAIFVDGSGRRGRRLRRAAYLLVALALLLLVAFWVVQGLDAFGSPA